MKVKNISQQKKETRGEKSLKTNSLAKKKCIPCEDNQVKPFTRSEANEYVQLVPEWTLSKNSKQITRTVICKNFVKALAKVNQVGALAESEGHHPDIAIHYNRIDFVVYTHSVGGLTENDFILATKMNKILKNI